MRKIIKKIITFFFTTLACRVIGTYKDKPVVNFYTRFTKYTHLGKNCNFNGLIIRGNGEIIIGDNFHSGKECLFINSYHKYDSANAIPYDTKIKVDKNIIVKDNVWIGDRVLILGGVTLGEGSIIQAGSVVVKDIPPFAIAGGNPAQVFKYRDINNYSLLKDKGLFC